jgi:capsid protein
VKRVNENHYTSQRRYIFEQWSGYVSREVYFINCMKNVLTKSMLNDGFQSIRDLARDYQYSVVRQEILTKYFAFLQRRKTLSAFSQWKKGSFNNSK